MRILVYIEPYPIRSEMTHFAGVAKSFAPVLACPSQFDVRMFANDATFAANKDALESHQKKLIRTTQSDEQNLSSYQELNWAKEGLATWLDLMAGKGEAAEMQIEMLRRIRSVFPFEVIVHWGENGAITRFCKEHAVTRVAMELGCTRPPFFNSLVMDPFGTNGSAVVPKLTTDDLREIVDHKPMSSHQALFAFSSDISAPGYSLKFDPVRGELDARWKKQKTAFLPLQLFDDANLTRFSNYKTLSDVVLDVVPRLSEAGYFTIIKPHPASVHRAGSVYENAFARRALMPWSDSVLWYETESPASNARLFSLADLVVTVNSSVGFEALYYDKPVVALGEAVYKPRDLFPSLDEALSGSFDLEAYSKSVGLLRSFMLGGYLQPESLLRDPVGFYNRISLIHHASQTGSVDPKQFAMQFWRACAPAQTSLAMSSMLWGNSAPGHNEFGAKFIKAKTADEKSGPTENSSGVTKYKLPLPIVNQLKTYWLAKETAKWIEEKWETKAGRAEVVTSGRMVDKDFYRSTYPDVEAANVDPSLHYADSGIDEGRSPREGFPGSSSDAILEDLLSCANTFSGDEATSDQGGLDDAAVDACQNVFDNLMKHVAETNCSFFSDWLSAAWLNDSERSRILMLSDLVDPAYYLERYSDVREAQVDPVWHYVQHGIAEGRSPCAGIDVSNSADLLALFIASVENAETTDQLPGFPLPEGLGRLRSDQIRTIRETLSGRGSKIAVVAHLYYTDLVPDILSRLATLKEEFDLIVTMPDWGNARTIELVRTAYPEALFYTSANRGRDIGPFIDLMPILVEKGYDAVLKLHTKRGYFTADRMIPEYGDIWRNDTFDALLGTEERVAAIIEGFRTQPNLNMVGAQPFLLTNDTHPYHDGGVIAQSIIGKARADVRSFFAGTMFWVRPSSLKSLTSLSITHFAPETGANDGALAHLIERMFGDAAAADHGALASAPIDPHESLNYAPQPLPISLDAYFENRQRVIRNRRSLEKQGALIW